MNVWVQDMLKIGICDMDTVFVEKLLDMLKNILYRYTDWETQIFQDDEEVMAAISNHTFDCNLLFMDIYQKNQSNMSVAQMVEARHVDTDIIYVTTSTEHVFECYKQHTFAYLLKPLREKDIAQEVKRYISEIQMNPKCLNISSRGETIRIPIDTILYVESNYRKIIVHTKNQDYEYYEKLDVLEQVLALDGFVRCHQSYLVAMDKISAYDGNVIQIGATAIPISRKYKTDIKLALASAEIAGTDDSVLESHAKTRKSVVCADGDNGVSACYVTTGLFHNNDTKGALVCVKGAYLGKIVRFVPEQTIMIGRDGTSADMIVNLPLVSRKHCSIIYHEQDNTYEVRDCSANGTFVGNGERLQRGDTYLLKPGASLAFGDMSVIYRLG